MVGGQRANNKTLFDSRESVGDSVGVPVGLLVGVVVSWSVGVSVAVVRHIKHQLIRQNKVVERGRVNMLSLYV